MELLRSVCYSSLIYLYLQVHCTEQSGDEAYPVKCTFSPTPGLSNWRLRDFARRIRHPIGGLHAWASRLTLKKINSVSTQKSLRVYIMNVWQLVTSVNCPKGPFSLSWANFYTSINVFPQPACLLTGFGPDSERTQMLRKLL